MCIRKSYCISVIIVFLYGQFVDAVLSLPSLTKEEIAHIGNKIWKNECGGSYEGLTTWKQGEAWPSLGIAHCIPSAAYPFQGTWSDLVQFLKQHGKKMPTGILTPDGQLPWKTREEFLAQFHSEKMTALRKFLYDTIPLQAQFVVQRFYTKFQDILKHTPVTHRAHVTRQLELVARSKNGMYALIDYLNFKGDGIQHHESYKGVRWGLLQVLIGMHAQKSGKQALEEFVRSAKAVLRKRVTNCADPQRRAQEELWLKGWDNRLATYLE